MHHSIDIRLVIYLYDLYIQARQKTIIHKDGERLTMTLIPLHAFNDNYIWIIKEKDSSQIWAIDPGDAKVVLQYCEKENFDLQGILITHHHKDHTGGVTKLKQRYQCLVYGPEHLTKLITHPMYDCDKFKLFSREFIVLATPGHTLDHLCYFSNSEKPLLLCGDTLFRGGCGRIMEGTPEQMLAAMTKLAQLPDETSVYCTHEYTLENYSFAEHIDKTNQKLIEARKNCEIKIKNKQVTLPSKISLEKDTNPFLRTNFFHIIENAAQQLGEPIAKDPVSSFNQVRRAKDSFN